MEAVMRMRIPGLGIFVGLAGLFAAGLAMAAPCYIILDKNDTAIYRDTAPPFDLSTSAGGAPERAMMRQRGDLLLIAEFDRCDAVGYISPTTGRTTATVDEIVMQLKPAVATSNPSGAGIYSRSGRPGSSGSYVGPDTSVTPSASGIAGGMRAGPRY
jgi:hypothetical protein